MLSRIPRSWSSCGRFLLLGSLAGSPACEAPQDEDAAYLRSLDDAEDEDFDATKGGVIINCPECGSHWTIEGGIVAVYLDADLGARIMPLADAGTFSRSLWRGQFDSYQDGPLNGYTIEIDPILSGYIDPEFDHLALEDAVLRVPYGEVFVDIRLRYVNNDKRGFDIPPVP